MAKLTSCLGFIEKAKAVHINLDGTPKYDYSKAEYINARSKITVICLKHGEFQQRAGHHLKYGCPKCGKERAQEANVRRSFSQEEYLQKCIEAHGNYYDYSKVVFTGVSSRITIICPKHGEFQQSAASHLYSKKGCIKCGNERHGIASRFTQEEFIQKCKAQHDSYYLYGKTVYEGSNKKITITCPKHGDFIQTALKHMNGHGCSKCAEEIHGLDKRLTQTDFLYKVEHLNEKYDFSESVYVTGLTPVKVFCKKCKRHFIQLPKKLFVGYGCGFCHMSIPEFFIEKYLNGHGIKNFYNHRFDDCRNETGHKLPFDFYLPELKTCIEYDGTHHFRIMNRCHPDAARKLTIIQRNDATKDEYCAKNGLKMIRIHFKDFKNIDLIFKRELGIKLDITSPSLLKTYSEEFFNIEEEKFNRSEITPWHFTYNKQLFSDEFNRLHKSKVSSENHTQYCTNLMEYYHRHLWFMNKNAVKMWERDKEKIIENRSKYAKITPRDLRRYFKINYVVPNMFQDSVARFMASQINGNLIFDPFAGFGGRMLGAVSLGKFYLGYDLNPLTVKGCEGIINELNIGDLAKVLLGDSSGIEFECDGIITSPPFFNKDNYGTEFSSLSQFLEFINSVFKNVKVRDKAIIDFKGYDKCTDDQFASALPFKNVERRPVNFGGMGHKSIHTWFYCTNN